MIFTLSREFIDKLESPDEDMITGLQYLADSRKHGEIELIADKEICGAIIACTMINEQAKNIYRWINDRIPSLMDLLNRSNVYVRVMPDKSESAVLVTSGRRIVSISIATLSQKIRLSLRPVLLCENLDDCIFLRHIGVIYCKNNGMTQRLEFSNRLGGGSTTANVLKEITNNADEMCICIVDSDKSYPEAALGNTAKEVQAISPKNLNPNWYYHILDHRELENIIPFEIVNQIYVHDKSKAAAMKDLERIQRHRDAWKYADIKEGTKLIKVKNNTDAYNYWSSVKPEIVRICANCSTRVLSCSEKYCNNYLNIACGDRLLRDISDPKNYKHSVRKLAPPLHTVWEELGLLIWSWGVAGLPIRA